MRKLLSRNEKGLPRVGSILFAALFLALVSVSLTTVELNNATTEIHTLGDAPRLTVTQASPAAALQQTTQIVQHQDIQPARQNVTFLLANRTYVYWYHASPPKPTTQAHFLVGVTSYACQKAQRDAIRKTWGSTNSSFPIRVVFIVANAIVTPKRRRRKQGICDAMITLEEEFDANRDLIWVQINENYRKGLTPKTISFFDYAVRIGTSGYTFKTDDDVYPDLKRFKRELEELSVNLSVPVQYYGVHGRKWPIRPGTGGREYKKNEVSLNEWPEELYPDYARGPGYAVHASILPCALREVATRTFFPMEDVNTGILMRACNASLPENNLSLGEHAKGKMYQKISLVHHVPVEALPYIYKQLPVP